VVVHVEVHLGDTGWFNDLVGRFSCVGCCVIFLIVFHLHVVALVVSWFFLVRGQGVEAD
jgi:hypothetical protein